MSIRVLVNGAFGKMGTLASETIEAHPDFQLVARLTRKDNLNEALVTLHPDIAIDLTTAESVYENSLTIIQNGVHPVIGSSGLVEKQIEELQGLCEAKQLGGIIAPNFSIAAVLMMRFAALAAPYLKEVEIVEAHHPQKLDAPSGTALKTAELIAKAREDISPKTSSKELLPGVRGGKQHEVTIHSIRLPGILAEQQIIFGSPGETLSIIHKSIDRASFMPGIILCCQKVMHLQKLYYGLDQIL